ncbi:Zinc-type alcohol dehydrogenase-like protein [Cyphellophora attinorum]|uniref:Zinc-type alcohol dehydrogenase-like protein n=1 Tax=Cyphellophora attinorum TaxID=1664694 RepID=A0A0N1H972_9EURO|nr:Zinc-type alcohol dehydrogenase-like protein [Phialophora attinorum]KPI40005.1 Zinc-type alcohol dehydrogenase-like protein [Phialophora attinorum]
MQAQLFTSTAPTLEANLRHTRDAPSPKNANSLKSDQLIVRVTAAALNPVDYKLASLPLIGRLIIGRPAAPGLDYAGWVASEQPPSPFKQGDKVFGRITPPRKDGTLAEYIVVSHDEVVPQPSELSAEDAACIGTAGLTAYQSIAPYVKKGDRVFINGGSGGTGCFGIQIAKCLGCHVTTTCSTANVELCRDLGADEVIDYRSTNVTTTLIGSGRSYQHVVDNVGADPNLWRTLGKWSGDSAIYVQVGAEISFVTLGDIVRKMLQPSWLGGTNRKFSMASVTSNAEHLSQIGQWVAEGKIKVIKDTVLPFKNASEGFTRLRTGRTRGKIVIRGPE